MLGNILRTSRCLARRQINTLTPVIRQYSNVRRLKYICSSPLIRRFSASTDNLQEEHIDPVVFEDICNETLESLCDYFEELIDQDSSLKGADVTYSVSEAVS